MVSGCARSRGSQPGAMCTGVRGSRGTRVLGTFGGEGIGLQPLSWAPSVICVRKIISASVSIYEGINLAKKDTKFGDRDVCVINCINASNICEKN